MITLYNNRLEIQIQEPGKKYQRPRFDWSGICEQITLDGAHTYLSQEATETYLGTEGVGLSDEFGIFTPIGYTETESDGWFPKIGVGFLQKEDGEPYTFEKNYQIRPAPISIEQGQDRRVTFIQVSENREGWAWKLQKTLSLEGPNLTIDYFLENTGDKPLITEGYNHNFLAINQHAVGPDYQLQTSFPVQPEDLMGPLAISINKVSLIEIPSQFFYACQTNCPNQQDVAWSLIHQPTGHGVRVSENFELFKFALWGMSHVISPEMFVWINLQPGETQTWKREYSFF